MEALVPLAVSPSRWLEAFSLRCFSLTEGGRVLGVALPSILKAVILLFLLDCLFSVHPLCNVNKSSG